MLQQPSLGKYVRTVEALRISAENPGLIVPRWGNDN